MPAPAPSPSPAAPSARLGDVRVDLLDEGTLRLDGGAMFRVVPRVLWEREHPPDASNRVLLGLRPLLVRTPTRTVLVECGIGAARRDAAFAARLDLRPGPGVEGGLAALGVAPEEVDLVVLTHLHFDHAGGLRGVDGRPRFPRARVVVQRGELEDGAADCPLCRASYVQEDWAALEDRLAPVDGDAELAPGVRVVRTGGHTRAHQVVLVEGGGRTLCAWGDLLPTAAHLRPHWVLGYDLYPVEAWQRKAALLPRAIDEGWLNVLYHEPRTPLGRVVPDGKGFRVEAP